jgi:tRNA 2-(methylsulfanyl)-N6-isopentenyladenosine37 hydroxylase
MLRLKLATDPRWAELVEGNIQDVLTDHAYCEQKAASSAISLIIRYPDLTELVQEMTALAREEMEHFQRVHNIIIQKGFTLGKERKDHYVNQLATFIRKDGHNPHLLIDRLLFAAMIEARSCERFRVLSENLKEKELAEFYRELMASEAGHYTLFIKLARKYSEGKVDVDKRWKEWLDFEAELIQSYGKSELIHG